MTNDRPNPDLLLAQVTRQEAAARRGKLKIFFGSNAGVGKTYAMLDEARKRAAEGANVLVGYAEPHIRPETEAILIGLEILPYKIVDHKGTPIKEFDLDAALRRHPTICCVDELAHTNTLGTPPPRHPKRWQDVQELLDAGINVYTTLNVQHLESVNDIVQSITGIKVRETLPDSVLDSADEVELVDISPDELIERLREGRIYNPQQAEHALKNFFNRGNLIALRELALRKTAERVDAQMREARHSSDRTATAWAASERILVCIGPSPFAPQLVRTTRRLSAALHAPWFAAFVETPSASRFPPNARKRLADTMQLAEELGGQTVTLSGANIVEELLAFARQRNITKIVVGKPHLSRWREWFGRSLVDQLICHSGSIDIYVIRQDQDVPTRNPVPPEEKTFDPKPYAWSAAICLLATALGMFVYHVLGSHGQRFSNTNALMIQLLAVLFIAVRFGRGPSVAASLLSVALFDFTVVPPYYSFSVSDSQYLFTFAVMLITALVISALADRIRLQAIAARSRERRTSALFSLSRELAATRERPDIARAVVQHVSDVFDSPAALFMPNAKNELALAATHPDIDPIDEKELGVVQWVFDHRCIAGQGTDTLPFAAGIFLPMIGAQGPVGVLGLIHPQRMRDHDRLRLLEAFANQSALALERVVLAEESRRAWERVEAEFLRNTLLSGVSHDLRTPLATITGAASTIADRHLSDDACTQLAQGIVTESERMERLIANLLDITRLEASGFPVRKDWHSLSEIIGAAIHTVRKRLADRTIQTDIPADLPLISIDAIAIEQVLVNLLENAAAYTPPTTAIELIASISGEKLQIEVRDHGPGLPPGDPNQVFQKFFRGPIRHPNGRADDGQRRGVGLGLAISKGIIELHCGTITAENRSTGGATFRIQLPTGGTPPSVPAEEVPETLP